ncbi:MAG: T9SS type A sorting domain-containing protein, partial [Fidelibacterota bacterium]
GRTLTLQPGWNLIGSPYSFPVKLDVDQAEFYGPLTYGGDTGEGWSDVVSELLPWGGYALYNRENTARTLRIDPLAGPASLPRVADKPFDGWKLQLSVRGATYSDPANFIGRVAGAKDDLDRFDNPEPPYLDEYVSLAMDRPGWSRLSGPGPAAAGIPRFTSDIRSPRGTNGVWDIDLYVKGEEGPVRISPHLFGEVPRDFQVVLLDLMTREMTDLTSGNDGILIADYIPAHDFQGKVLPHPFKVIAGAADYVTRTVDEILSMLPEKVALFQNYPNPFNPSTRIRYALPRPGLVSLKVYNLLGQEVVTLVDEWKPGGYHRILWDGTDSRGAPVGTGIYIFRLHTQEPRGTTSRTRKMLLLK